MADLSPLKPPLWEQPLFQFMFVCFSLLFLIVWFFEIIKEWYNRKWMYEEEEI